MAIRIGLLITALLPSMVTAQSLEQAVAAAISYNPEIAEHYARFESSSATKTPPMQHFYRK